MNRRRLKEAPVWLCLAVQKGMAYALQRRSEVNRIEDHARLVANYIFTQMGPERHDWEQTITAMEAALPFLEAEVAAERTNQPLQRAYTLLYDALEKARTNQ